MLTRGKTFDCFSGIQYPNQTLRRDRKSRSAESHCGQSSRRNACRTPSFPAPTLPACRPLIETRGESRACESEWTNSIVNVSIKSFAVRSGIRKDQMDRDPLSSSDLSVEAFASFALAPTGSDAGCCARTENETSVNTTNIPIAYFDRRRQTSFIGSFPPQIFWGTDQVRVRICITANLQFCGFIVNN